jgi:ABC-type polar amino acid transport system ATPase subunit
MSNELKGPLEQGKPILTVENVTKSYGGNPVIKNVGFEQRVEDHIVIIGPSGAGKSTLLRLMAGLEEVDEGRVLFQGEPLKADRKSRYAIKGEIGMLFQSFNLFPHLSVLQNITIAPRKVRGEAADRAEHEAIKLLERVGLRQKAHSYPEELSGGEAQRIAIARALAMDPKLMLFDEPTSSLDPELTKEVLDVMVDLVDGGMTVAVVTHEMGFARRASNRVIFMADGRVVEDGPTEQVFEAPENDRTAQFLKEILSH